MKSEEQSGAAEKKVRGLIRRVIRRTFIALAGLLLVLVFVTVVTPQGRTLFRTALLLPQILPAIPVKPLEWISRDPVRQEIEFPLADGHGVADLYLPAGSRKHSAVLFFLGVVPPDRDERRVVALGEGLARSGIVVMIPWLDSQRLERISPDDVDQLVRAFQHLLTLDSVDPAKVGMGGICTGASLATVAAQDERIRDEVKFINFFAGYYNAFDLVKAIAGRERFYGDEVRPWRPDKLTMKLFTFHLIDGVANADDRALLTRLLVDKQVSGEGELESLTPERLAVYKLVSGVPSEDADQLIEQLSPVTHDFLRLTSPSTHIDQLQARMLIMHDRANRLVPSEESRRLVDALDEDNDAYYTEFSFFQKQIQVHVDENEGVGPIGYVREGFKLLLHMYKVMRELS